MLDDGSVVGYIHVYNIYVYIYIYPVLRKARSLIIVVLFAPTAMSLVRASVLFKSVAHARIFIDVRNTLNLPGGRIEEVESLSKTVVREVIEKLGGWLQCVYHG